MSSADLERLRALALEPIRSPMSRTHQFPTMAAEHVANKQEIITLRTALREALAIIDRLNDRLREPPRDGGDL